MHSSWLASGYSAKEGHDLLLLRMQSSGSLEIRSGLRLGNHPSFLCQGADGIYAAEEYEQGASVLLVKGDGEALYVDGEIHIDGCSGLCHLLACGEIIVGCCYGSGDVFAVDAALTKVLWRHRNATEKEGAPHAHWSALVDEQTLCCADLGLDMLLWRRTADGALLGRTELEAGSGPRQVILSEGKGYVINELSGTLDVLDATGKPRTAKGLRTTRCEVPYYPGATCLARNQMLYVANRGADTIAAIDVSAASPRFVFEADCGGMWPRWITLDDREDFLICCNQRSGHIVSLRISESSLDICGGVALENAACAVLDYRQR